MQTLYSARHAENLHSINQFALQLAPIHSFSRIYHRCCIFSKIRGMWNINCIFHRCCILSTIRGMWNINCIYHRCCIFSKIRGMWNISCIFHREGGGGKVKSVKCYPGGRKIPFIPSISEILSEACYHCVQYTRHHLMSLVSHW